MADGIAGVKPASSRGGPSRAAFGIWVLRRLAYSLPTVVGVIVLDFFLLQAAPGDYADYSAAQSGVATAETLEAMRQRLGLDQSIWLQFLGYVSGLFQGDLGMSSLYGRPVFDVVLERIPNTLLLVASTLVFALVVGTILGTIAGSRPERPTSRFIMTGIVVLYSMPSFLKGLFLIIIFSVMLGWLPSNGYMSIGASLNGWETLLDRARHLVLPVLTLSLFYIAIYARIVAASMLDVRKQNYIRTAQAKGLSDRQIVVRHMLRNALLPLSAVAGIHIGMMLSGAVIVETIFAWPGLGGLAYDALFARDFQLVLGILLLSSFTVIVSNILVDIVQMLIDPRIRE